MFIPVWYWSDISNKSYGKRSVSRVIGNWWDSKGENEIDIVAVNRIDRTARIAEVKINRNKISMPVLERKSQKLIGELKRYQIEYTGYSLEDM